MGDRGAVGDAYEQYVRAEWDGFARDPARTDSALAAAAGLSVARVLDIGCGAGQELRPFVRDGRVLGVGVDISPVAGQAGRGLFAAHDPGSRVAFVRAAAEDLPFEDGCFDLLICRLALPYTDNRRALGEMARVLRPGGALLLKFHHARFYLAELGSACAARKIKPAIHACRVLLAGMIYNLTGVQLRTRLTGGETYQTMSLLRRELRGHGLDLRRLLDGSAPAAPSVLIVRTAHGATVAKAAVSGPPG